MDEKGKVVKQAKFINDPEGLQELIEGLEEVLVVMDALDRQIAKISWGLKRMCGEDPRGLGCLPPSPA